MMSTRDNLITVLAIVGWYFLWRKGLNLKTPKDLNPQYDYIIVGGGTAGSVLATRLSEVPGVSVLVLEAGADHYSRRWSHIPLFAPLLQNTEMDWAYRAQTQDNAYLGLEGGVSFWPMGRCLGGSSVLNYMLYGRPRQENFDSWPNGWKYDDLLPYFVKSESSDIEGEHRGSTGPLIVSRDRVETTLGTSFLDAARELNFPVNSDYNDPNSFYGFSATQSMKRKGLRVSVAKSYLEPVLSRDNLHVVTGAMVSRVILNEDSRATSVEYYHNDKLHRVLTNREIIVSAGAIETPKLLMLSGIGPVDQLESNKIDQKVNLPKVGHNLLTHVLVDLNFVTNESVGVDFDSLIYRPDIVLTEIAKYIFMGTGLLSLTPVEALATLDVDGLDESDDDETELLPDIDGQILLMPSLPASALKWNNFLNIANDTLDQTFGDVGGRAGFVLASTLLSPKSVGRIELTSTDFKQNPVIKSNVLSDRRDVVALRNVMKLALRMTRTESLERHGTMFIERKLNLCQEYEFDPISDEYLECLVRVKTFALFHPVGTCAMGNDETDSVVDSELRVHKTKGLRIVDASVFRTHISTNPVATVVAIAEKAAEMIKKSN